MSRCFPYPPPNYRRSETALIESIQQEREKANEQRKEKKREKDGRKKKVVMSKDECGKSKYRAHNNKKRKYDDMNVLHKKSKVAMDQLERSGLTEEHGLPCSVQEPCESSESTQNSSKSRKLESTRNSSKSRKLESTQSNSMSMKLEAASVGHGSTVLRFRLPLQKHTDPESLPDYQTTISQVADATVVLLSRTTSKIPESARVSEDVCLSGRTASKVLEPNRANEEPCFPGSTTKLPAEAVELGENVHIESSTRSKRRGRTQKLEMRFRDLTVNWKPAPFLLDADIGNDNQGWLYGNSPSHAKGCGFINTSLDSGCGIVASSFQPRACYLPELETYLLPYAIPL